MPNARYFLLLPFISVVMACGGSSQTDQSDATAAAGDAANADAEVATPDALTRDSEGLSPNDADGTGTVADSRDASDDRSISGGDGRLEASDAVGMGGADATDALPSATQTSDAAPDVRPVADAAPASDAAPDARPLADAALTSDAAPDVGPGHDAAAPAVGLLPVGQGAVLGSGQAADNVNAYVLTADASGNAYVAGFTSDWAQLGLSNPGRAGVAFVARVAPNGDVAWATALPANWWPYAIALDGEQPIVVSANLDTPATMAFSYSSSYAVARLSAQGAIAIRQTFTYPAGVRPSAVVVDGARRIHVAATTVSPNTPGLNESFELARLNTDLTLDKATQFAHVGSNARINALALSRTGDLLLAGYFDNGVNFGGGVLQTKNLGSYYACAGFFARLTPDHTYVLATQVGGDSFADVLDVVEREGSIYLGGGITGAATIGGISAAGDSETSGFVAKLDAQGKAEWVNVWPGRSWVSDLAAGADRVIAAGSLADTRYIVQDVRDKPAQPDQAALTLTTTKENPAALAAGGSSFWLSLGFRDQLTLAPAGTQIKGRASTLLLRFAQ